MPPWLHGPEGMMLRRLLARKSFYRRAMLVKRFLLRLRRMLGERILERIQKMRRFRPKIDPETIKRGLGEFLRRMMRERLRRHLPPAAPQAAWF